MKAIISNKEEVASGTLLVEFKLVDKTINFKPGQFFFISLKNPPYEDRRGDIRHFSIVNSPTQNDRVIMVTRLRDSGFKKSLQELPLGSEVEIGSPNGDFILPESPDKPLVFIAGGIGITPYISMLRYIQEKVLPHKVTLIYSNKNQAGTAFREELTKISHENKNIRVIFTYTEDPSWIGEKRRIDQQFLHDYLSSDLNTYQFFISGPPGLVDALYQVLKASGVHRSNIKTEGFSGY